MRCLVFFDNAYQLLYTADMNKENQGKLCADCRNPVHVDSIYCRSCAKKGKRSKWFGKKHTEETKRKISLTQWGDKNSLWKGDKVGYAQLHRWVRTRKPRPALCEKCNQKPALDLASKGTYNRELENWEWLCRKCHMLSDGRSKKVLQNLKQYRKGVQNPLPRL